MPKRTSQASGPENAPGRGEAGSDGIGGILGPRAEEIEAAAKTHGKLAEANLRRLAASGRFGVSRPPRKPDKFGAEHDVFLAADGLRVFKHARNYGFEPAIMGGELVMKCADPTGYLARHALMEQIFPTDVLVEGLTGDGHFVISQRVIRGNHPTETAIRKYLRGIGFVNVPARFGQAGQAWFHRGLGVLVMDTAPDNFISSKQGIVPIDLQIAELTAVFLELADEVEDLSKQAPEPRR